MLSFSKHKQPYCKNKTGEILNLSDEILFKSLAFVIIKQTIFEQIKTGFAILVCILAIIKLLNRKFFTKNRRLAKIIEFLDKVRNSNEIASVFCAADILPNLCLIFITLLQFEVNIEEKQQKRMLEIAAIIDKINILFLLKFFDLQYAIIIGILAATSLSYHAMLLWSTIMRTNSNTFVLTITYIVYHNNLFVSKNFDGTSLLSKASMGNIYTSFKVKKENKKIIKLYKIYYRRC